MLILNTLTGIAMPPSAVAIGLFDGLHRGHRAVINRALALAKERHLRPVVLTFSFAHTSRPASKPSVGQLLSQQRFCALLEEMGVHTLVHLPFEAVRDFSPGEFVQQVLIESLHAGVICCGENFRFGKQASAGTLELAALGQGDFSLEVVPLVDEGGAPVSSTRIRQALAEGDIAAVNEMLGYPYVISGEVVHGSHLGRTLGMPTINQHFPAGFLIPRQGVYASVTTVEGKRYPSVTDIGVKPTVGSEHPLAETHIHGYEGDLYGSDTPVELLAYLREEQKFPDIPALVRQMQADLAKAVAIAAPFLL